MPGLAFFFLFSSLFAVFWDVSAQTPYQLSKPNPIEESWRWQELEALRGNVLYCGMEDEAGVIWFGSNGGLLSYDGRQVEKILYPEGFTSVVSYCVFINGLDDVFVFTSKGLLRFKGDEWQVLQQGQDQIDFPNNRPLMATNSVGLTVLATPSGLYELDGDVLKPVVGMSELVASVVFDRHDNLWVVSGNGTQLNQFPATGKTIPSTALSKRYQFQHAPGVWMQIRYNEYEDELLIHSWRPDTPAYRYDKATDKFAEEVIEVGVNAAHMGSMAVGSYGFVLFLKTAMLSYHEQEWTLLAANDQKLPINGTFSIQRKSGNVIIGGRGEAIYEIDYANQRWDSFMGLNFQCEDKVGHFWFISLEGEVVEYDPVSRTALQHVSNVIDSPLTILCASNGSIWVAGAHEDVAAISHFDGEEWTRDLHPLLQDHISYLSALELSSGDLAFGGGFEFLNKPGGMVIYRKTENAYEISYVLNPRVPARIVGLAQTDPEHIWFGGGELVGSTLPGLEASLAIEELNVLWYDHISADKNGGLWVATWERGLFHLKEGVWTHFNRENGLRNEQVLYVLNDNFKPDTTWVATRLGLSKFENGYWINDVLPRNFQFSRESGTLKQSSDGSIWINTASRDWYYRKQNSSFQASALQSVFKTIRYVPDTQPPVAHFLDYTAKITEPASFHIKWKASDVWSVTPVAKLEYSYRLDDEDWSPFTLNNSVILTDLSKGGHSFELRTRDLDGNESRIAEPAIFTVIPPLWQRTWFILSLITVIVVIITLVVLLIRQRVQSILHLEEFKLQFFTNLSHELRTPLSLILGPLEQLASKLPKGVDQGPLVLARRNANKLLHLVEQILEFRRHDLGKVQLHPSYADLIDIVKKSIHSVEPLSLGKKQTVYFVSQLDSYRAWFDPDTMDKILDNLIGNAIKYTETGGEIIIKVSVEEASSAESVLAFVTVEDNGIGISEEKISHIFDPFYRVSDSYVQKNRGSGLGLALSKSLVESFGGGIKVESPISIIKGKARGTRFVVTLPLKKQPPLKTKQVDSEENTNSDSLAKLDSVVQLEEVEEAESVQAPPEKPSLLLVEDEADMRLYLKSELEGEFTILEAADGNAGLILAVQEIPDLIISDVMMPEMNGQEFCARIKSDEITSHIPVFMLTSLKSSQHELKSLNKGADDFFTKPVNVDILKQRIRNLFDYRRRLHERFNHLTSEQSFDTKAITSNPLDESFLNRAMRIIEEHLSDPLFDVEAFAVLMHGSRMTLYRKFKALTGESPSHCVRRMRMKKAAELLSSGNFNVSEVSDRVGMQDVTYFSTAFKKHYRITPSEFIAKPGRLSIED